MSWLAAVLGLALLVLLHELGHFAVARLVGIKPRALYVGFPPAVVKIEPVYERLSAFGMALILFVTVVAFLNDIGATPR